MYRGIPFWRHFLNRFHSFRPGAGLILDPTCGPASWWDEFPDARVIKCDIRNPEAADVIGDAAALPFQDAVFDEIWCDPPHLIRKATWAGKANPRYTRYGLWNTRSLWEAFLDNVNGEFLRVLKPDGRLIMKVINGADRRVIKRDDLDRLTLWRVDNEEVWKSPIPLSTCWSHMVELLPVT